MTVTVTWQAAMETGDVSEFDASVTMDSGTAAWDAGAPSSVTTTTNATASTTDKKTGTYSLRPTSSGTAVKVVSAPIMGFWIKPNGGNTGANYFRLRVGLTLSTWAWSEEFGWVLSTYTYTTATHFGIQAGTEPGTIRFETHSVEIIEVPGVTKYEQVSTNYTSDVPIREGVWQHWQIDARDGIVFWIDGVQVPAATGSISGYDFLQFGGSGTLSSYTYVDNIYTGTTDAAPEVVTPSPDYRWALVEGVLTLTEPTPEDIVEGFGAYAEGETAPAITVDGFGAYAEGTLIPRVTIDGFGVYVELISKEATGFWLGGVNLEDWIQNAKLEATINKINTTHFASTGGEAIPGVTRWAFPIGGHWDVTVDAKIGPLVGHGNQPFSVSFDNVIYSWNNGFLVDYTIDLSSPRDGVQWMAAVAGIGPPERVNLT